MGSGATHNTRWPTLLFAAAILTALTLRAVFRLAYRQAEGLIASIINLLGLALRVPDHTTLSRRSTTLTVPRPQPGNAGADDGAQPLHLLSCPFSIGLHENSRPDFSYFRLVSLMQACTVEGGH